MDSYLSEKEKLTQTGDYDHPEFTEDKHLEEEYSDWHINPYTARLSPSAKEKIYLDFRAGTSV